MSFSSLDPYLCPFHVLSRILKFSTYLILFTISQCVCTLQINITEAFVQVLLLLGDPFVTPFRPTCDIESKTEVEPGFDMALDHSTEYRDAPLSCHKAVLHSQKRCRIKR
ncbi:hypothetical protein M3J09_003460 [Ascochyta lentis]